MTAVRTRRACRVFLLDPTDRLLMLRVADRGDLLVDGRPSPPTYWITVGGGLEGEETFEEAAHREVFEETGIESFHLGPALWDREVDFHWKGEHLHSFERYFAAWTEVTDVVFDHHDEEERDVVKEHRWWPLADLTAASCTAAYFPEQLPSLFEQTIRLRPAAPT